ncbi:Rv1733c family protein [Streptomyces flavofungini]|uniref:Transmembrane protein n=1 Tax=Streptomyces flavofungini TaxID=68200 RepID=A0ABS0XHG0_9ACTN|nr:hypothetical protein [Streptomyces flavofungini]MBJ3812652.1 hypothetical protein [Streptomyces flavofungini]GHC89734.1 hypothetical protein GCM10010349_77750 [Streptomyces flavofungini]
MGSGILWWRLRRSPLRRRSDVIEAWTMLVVAVVLFVGVPAAGIVVGAIAHVDGVAAARAERADRHRVTAVLTANAPPLVPDVDGSVPLHQVPARWTAPDGAARTGDAQAPAGSRRGERVAVWLDRHGQVTDDPLDADDVALRVFGASTAAAAGTALAALITLWAVRAILGKRRMAAWDDEWQKTGPEWGSHKS